MVFEDQTSRRGSKLPNPYFPCYIGVGSSAPVSGLGSLVEFARNRPFIIKRIDIRSCNTDFDQ